MNPNLVARIVVSSTLLAASVSFADAVPGNQTQVCPSESESQALLPKIEPKPVDVESGIVQTEVAYETIASDSDYTGNSLRDLLVREGRLGCSASSDVFKPICVGGN